jgi:hypothetical protein
MKTKQHLLNNIQRANEKPVKRDRPYMRSYLLVMAFLVVAALIALSTVAS